MRISYTKVAYRIRRTLALQSQVFNSFFLNHHTQNFVVMLNITMMLLIGFGDGAAKQNHE